MLNSQIKLTIPFDTRQYLNEYFLDTEPEIECLYEFWHSSLKTISKPLLALELGVGPTLYSTILVAEFFSEIHLADYLNENIIEIDKWLKQESDCFSWHNYIQLALTIAGKKGTFQEIEERAEKIRQAVTKLSLCDFRSKLPITQSYNLVTAHYCTEVAVSNIEEWNQTIKNICQLIISGGSLLLSIATNYEIYRVYDPSVVTRTVPNITEELILSSLSNVGMNIQTIKMLFVPAPDDHPYGGSILVFAQKLDIM